MQRVYEQVEKSKLDHVIVATDDERIYNAGANLAEKL